MVLRTSSVRRIVSFGAAAVVVLVLLLAFVDFTDSQLGHLYDDFTAGYRGTRRPHRNIAVGSAFGNHFDVYMALVKTLGSAIKPDTSGPPVIHLFTPGDFHYGFQQIVDDLALWPYRGANMSQDDLIEHINQGVIDLVVFGTCEIDLRHYHEKLQDAWERREAFNKFKIVCVVHNIKDFDWQSRIPFWAARDAIRILPIGNHVANNFKASFAATADENSPVKSTIGYEDIPVNVHVPLLDIPNLPVKSSLRTLSTAVIQGSFAEGRRSYASFFGSLVASLNEDPAAWGYQPLSGRPSHLPLTGASMPPFRLLLVGSGSITIPTELEHVVTIHSGQTYSEFYKLIAGTDIVVPAFGDMGYFEDQASSTVSLAMQLNVPLLVTQRTREAYGYIDDDRVVVTRPAAMSEVQALLALRTGDASKYLDSPSVSGGQPVGQTRSVHARVQRMMEQGWIRDTAAFDAFKRTVWARNKEVAEKILRDEP